MLSQDVCSPQIGLPILKDRPEIHVNDIIRLNDAGRGIIGGNRERVGARSYDAFVPMFLNAEFLQRDGINLLLYLALVTAGSKESSLFNFLEQLFSPFLGGNEGCPPALFRCETGFCHTCCPTSYLDGCTPTVHFSDSCQGAFPYPLHNLDCSITYLTLPTTLST